MEGEGERGREVEGGKEGEERERERRDKISK